MGKAILIIWMGVGYSQTIDTLQFNTIAECETARRTMRRFGKSGGVMKQASPMTSHPPLP